jgi:hypothetical protein
MWLFTETGFVSAVQHRDDENLLVVRARDRLSLEPLSFSATAEITTNPYADYPYRVIVSKTQFNTWVSSSIKFLDYPNFKDQVKVVRGNVFARTLGSVWATMLDAEDAEAHAMRQNIDRHLGFTEPTQTTKKYKLRK